MLTSLRAFNILEPTHISAVLCKKGESKAKRGVIGHTSSIKMRSIDTKDIFALKVCIELPPGNTRLFASTANITHKSPQTWKLLRLPITKRDVPARYRLGIRRKRRSTFQIEELNNIDKVHFQTGLCSTYQKVRHSSAEGFSKTIYALKKLLKGRKTGKATQYHAVINTRIIVYISETV